LPVSCGGKSRPASCQTTRAKNLAFAFGIPRDASRFGQCFHLSGNTSWQIFGHKERLEKGKMNWSSVQKNVRQTLIKARCYLIVIDLNLNFNSPLLKPLIRFAGGGLCLPARAEREGPERFEGNFEGLLQTNGYGAYDLLARGDPKTVHSAYWAQATEFLDAF
jgi:hypothetical protein